MARQEKEVITLAARINAFPLVVTYTPLPGEVAFSDYLELTSTTFVVPLTAAIDPFETGKRIKERADGWPACILLPGRMFDAHGTRLGRGGGWYDRLLMSVPATWPRIGICPESKFSNATLPRQSWDQPVDAVLVIGRDGPRVVETHARPEIVW